MNETTKDVYREYYEFCIGNNFQPMSNIEFSRQVAKYYGYKIINRTIKGKKCRIFVEEEK